MGESGSQYINVTFVWVDIIYSFVVGTTVPEKPAYFL